MSGLVVGLFHTRSETPCKKSHSGTNTIPKIIINTSFIIYIILIIFKTHSNHSNNQHKDQPESLLNVTQRQRGNGSAFLGAFKR